jgi:hypothetical protein
VFSATLIVYGQGGTNLQLKKNPPIPFGLHPVLRGLQQLFHLQYIMINASGPPGGGGNITRVIICGKELK